MPEMGRAFSRSLLATASLRYYLIRRNRLALGSSVLASTPANVNRLEHGRQYDYGNSNGSITTSPIDETTEATTAQHTYNPS